MPKLSIEGDELHLSLSGAQDFQTALSMAKAVPGRRFDGETKLWKYPKDPSVAERLLLTVKPSADTALLAWVRASRAEREQELTTQLPDDASYQLFVPWANKMYDYQRAFVEFAVKHPKLILADDMGLGKTVQALSAVTEQYLEDTATVLKPKLVVCPASAMGVWAREIRKWLGDDEPYVIVDAKVAKKRDQQLKEAVKANGWAIVNWEQIRVQKHTESKTVHHRDGTITEQEVVTWPLKQPLFEETDWYAVIADEAHRAKNRKAAQSRGLHRIQADMMLALTGTPLMNAPDELWSLLHWLYPEQYGKSSPGQHRTAFWPFHEQFTESIDGYGTSKIVIGVKNPDALRFELKERLVRRTKAQKLASLPDKTREYIPLTMSAEQAKIYSEAETNFWLTIEQQIEAGDKTAKKFAEEVLAGTKKIYEISNGAARVVRLRQVLCSPALLGGKDISVKLDAVQERILDNSHQQHVVFTEFVGGADLLVARLRKDGVAAEAFTGAVTDMAIRTHFEDKFQQGKIDVLVGTLGAMRESITLTASNIMHFVERSWVPAWNEQAEDREHRVGQKNPVTILIYQVENSVDTDKVQPTNEMKEMLVANVIAKDKVKVVT